MGERYKEQEIMEIGKSTKKVIGWVIIALMIIGLLVCMVWAWGFLLCWR